MTFNLLQNINIGVFFIFISLKKFISLFILNHGKRKSKIVIDLFEEIRVYRFELYESMVAR